MKFLLFPFAIVYDVITRLRNRLYDLGYKPMASFDVTTVGVGNLAVGGTGKSPMVEHLIRLLKNHNIQIATLSRGYGRSTRGVRIAKPNDNASTIGDEPFQFFRKFNQNIPVVVGEERALAIPYIMDEYPDTQVILLDDAFQHRQVKIDFQILLTDHSSPFYRDYLLPTGFLRESKAGATRADCIVVTKCPIEIQEEQMISMEKEIRRYSAKPIFFTTIRYGGLVHFGKSSVPTIETVVLVTGIANAKTLINYINQNYKLLRHFEFGDHHNYSAKDITEVVETAIANNALVITTEKDSVKLNIPDFQSVFNDIFIAYLPIEIDFIKNGKDFDEMVLAVIKKSKKVD